MKLRSSKTLISLAFCAGVIVIGVGFFQYYSRQADQKPQSVALKLYGVRKHDQAVLSSGTAEAKEIAISLKRYSSQNLPGSEDYIKYYIKDAREEVAVAALMASGAFKWADLDMFANALKEGSIEAQKAALEGLAKRPAADRSALVENYLRSAKSEELQLQALITLAKMAILEEEKVRLKSRILSFVAKKPADLKLTAYKAVFALYPRDPQMVVQAESILENGKFTQLIGPALRYIQHEPSEHAMAMFSRLNLPDDHETQMVALDFIRQNCPVGWRTVLTRIQRAAANPRIMEESGKLATICK